MCRKLEGFEHCDYCHKKLEDKEDHIFSKTSPDGKTENTAGYLACLSCWEKEKSKGGE